MIRHTAALVGVLCTVGHPLFFRPDLPPMLAREIQNRCDEHRMFLPGWCGRNIKDGSTVAPVPGAAPAATTGWGWSDWGAWGGTCPDICPGRCRVRGRYCSGVCPGKASELSDCPELETDGVGEEDGEGAENPFS